MAKPPKVPRPHRPSEATLKLYRSVEHDWVVETLDGLFRLQSPWLELGDAQLGPPVDSLGALRAPVEPSKIVCIGLNYAHHAAEMNKQVPDEPLFFLKPPTSLNDPGGAIELPPSSELIHHEGELAVVIGKQLRRASEAEAADAIFGYTCANDVTARDIQRREKRYTRGKGFDTFCPIGPCVVPASDFVPAEHAVELRVNGERRQYSQLNDFIFELPYAISFISHVMTLLPGDVVLTGTPHGVGPIVDGDTVEVEIDGIGILRNPATR